MFSGGGQAHRFGDIADDTGHQAFIVTLGHHADQLLGTGRTDDQAAGFTELLLARVDRLFDTYIIKGLTRRVPDVLQDLRQRREAVAHLADGLARGDDDGQHFLRPTGRH